MKIDLYKIYKYVFFSAIIILIVILVYGFFVRASKPYDVSRAEGKKIINFILQKNPEFADKAKVKIESDSRIKEIFLGKFDWHIYRKDKTNFYVLYGYFGYEKVKRLVPDFIFNFVHRKNLRALKKSLCFFLTVDFENQSITGASSIDSTLPIESNSDL